MSGLSRGPAVLFIDCLCSHRRHGHKYEKTLAGIGFDFAETLLSVLEKNIKEIPDEIFKKNGFRREDVLFFTTMGDGDYIEEMIEASVRMFNAQETLAAYGLTE